MNACALIITSLVLSAPGGPASEPSGRLRVFSHHRLVLRDVTIPLAPGRAPARPAGERAAVRLRLDGAPVVALETSLRRGRLADLELRPEWSLDAYRLRAASVPQQVFVNERGNVRTTGGGDGAGWSISIGSCPSRGR